ncbi:MAG TPA: malto-oligosyltrehalose trehalohydrolase, partial [Rhodoglobus sp.]|nr:malto-oligosyltrehalose trehalohydrolase [Rhodoglobus sp.]
EGVHGLSRTFDPAQHAWQDGEWRGIELRDGILYELHLGTFTPEGTFDAAIERLDHLVDLGVNLVELLPVNGFNGTHNWGYDGVLWYTVQEQYGGPAAYQRFVDACHARGLGVVQDVVYNHLGPSGNVLPRFGPIFTEGRNTWGETVNLADRAVRDLIIENALMWLRDYHADGLRLDAVHALIDPTETHLLQELAERVDALAAELRRPLITIAESDMNDPKLITPREDGGYGLTAQWSDDYHHAAHVNLTGETTGYYADFDSLAALAKAMERGFFHDGTWSSFREREHGHPIDRAAVPTWRLVTYTQDHDQVGNRATGDRLTENLDAGGLALAAALTVLTPNTPMLFMGEEWAASTPWPFFTSHPEPELGKATAEGRIAEFEKMGWDPDVVPDPQDPQTFASAKLRWDERLEGDRARLLELYRALIALRRTEPGLTDPDMRTVQCTFDEDARWFRVQRPGVALLLNFADQERELPGDGEVLLSSGDAAAGAGVTRLPARSFAVVRSAS